jgi:hypothetical protein
VNMNMSAGIVREVTRGDASTRVTHPVPDIDIPAAEDAVRSLLVALGQDLFQRRVPSGVSSSQYREVRVPTACPLK